MISFSEWLLKTEQTFVGVPSTKIKGLNKQQILQHWQALRPNVPLPMLPISAGHKGSTYSQDAIRVTGSQQFIDAVIGRLKDLIYHENNQTYLEVIYRAINSNHPENQRPASFVFYVMAKQKAPHAVKPQKLTAKNHLEIIKISQINPVTP